MEDLIRRSDAIKAIDDKVNGSDNRLWLREIILELPSADRPQGEWIEVSTLREIFGDVQYAHRGNSEAEAVIADVWYEVKDVLKGADDE